MLHIFGGLLCFPVLVMFLLVLVPATLFERRAGRLIRLVTGLAAVHAAVSFIALANALLAGPVYLKLIDFGQKLPVGLSLYLDGVSTLMLTLVASVGWVICRFSVRYLDAEVNQARYFRWTAFTIASVSLAVAAGNLAVLLVGLLLTSIGLHQLLVHYADRPAAHRAAGIKFVFSRLGDVCLLAASVILYWEFGTLELPDLFAAVADLQVTGAANSAALSAVGWLLVLCAAFKSAQFPFHTWLPETMEAPTPVSALMHAGIVNAGGYLLIRMAPVLCLAPTAMTAVAVLGAFTAVFAAMVMLSQTSVKRSLAWSTIAQMGFMMLQCGLGAFSAAMLHIVAHSLYKAHAFLSSGSVLAERTAMATTLPQPASTMVRIWSYTCSAVCSVVILLALATAFGISPASKPGGYLLGFVLCLGLTRWLGRMLQSGRKFYLPGFIISTLLIAAYLSSFVAVDSVVSPSLAIMPAAATGVTLTTSISIAAAFMLIFLLELALVRGRRSKLLNGLYVHSSNGFYIDTLWRRIATSSAN